MFDGRGGTLHWVVAPAGSAPTFRGPLASLLTFVPAEEASLEATFARPRRCARAVRPRSSCASRTASRAGRVRRRRPA